VTANLVRVLELSIRRSRIALPKAKQAMIFPNTKKAVNYA
jgi:hypothetical protein